MSLFLAAYEIWRSLGILESFPLLVGMKCWEVTEKSVPIVALIARVQTWRFCLNCISMQLLLV